MQISVEEVSRLLALAPHSGERRHRNSAVVDRDGAVQDGRPRPRVGAPPVPREVQRVKGELDRLPDVREARVLELKARIESGSYWVSGEDIADLIVRRAIADDTAA